MPFALTLAGYVVLVFGSFIGVASGNLMVVLISVVGGFLLLGVSRLIELMEAISHKLLQLPFTLSQLRTIIANSTTYRVESDAFDIHPNVKGEPVYPLVVLDDVSYLRAKVFYKYLSQSEDEYTFALPGQAPIVLRKADAYYKGAELFDYQDHVYVMLNSIHIQTSIDGNRLRLAYNDN